MTVYQYLSSSPTGKSVRLMVAAIVSCAVIICGTSCGASPDGGLFQDVLEERGNFSCLSPREAELFRLLNDYREKHGLPPIANSRSLNKVARIHAIDLYNNNPAEGKDLRGQECNLHSWSDQGFWSAVCYTSDHAYAELMRNKPREITGDAYPGAGYENAYWTSAHEIVPIKALESWKKSIPHNAVILETGKWQQNNLLAMGVGVYKNYALFWVGTMVDPDGPLQPCPTVHKSETRSLVP